MALCSERGLFLFQVRPDVFHCGYLSELETELWCMWYEDRAQRQKQQN